jgi:acyl-CoA synthetase (AMP-forming)/AMP-acid ligase II
MHPRIIAASDPDKPAVIMAASGASVTFAELSARADQIAQLFRSLGLVAGDGIRDLPAERSTLFRAVLGCAQRGALFHADQLALKTAEIAYILADCGAGAFITSAALRDVALGLPAAAPAVKCFMVDGIAPGFDSYESAVATMPSRPVDEVSQGVPMMYSSGTTGQPKGIRPPLPAERVEQLAPLPAKLRELYGFDGSTTYLSTAPLYHAAPLKFNLAVQACGGTSIVMEKIRRRGRAAMLDRYGCDALAMGTDDVHSACSSCRKQSGGRVT